MVGVCYTPPRQDKEEDEIFYKQLEPLALAVMGDFDLPDVCWKYNMAERKESRGFLEHVEENCLTQLVREPTRQGAHWTWCLSTEKGWREMWWLEAILGME